MSGLSIRHLRITSKDARGVEGAGWGGVQI